MARHLTLAFVLGAIMFASALGVAGCNGQTGPSPFMLAPASKMTAAPCCVGEDDPPAPPVLPPIKAGPPIDFINPIAATTHLSTKGGKCTATIVGAPGPDRRVRLLTACHCVLAVGAKGTVQLRDGRVWKVTCIAADARPDLAWLITDEPIATGVPYALALPAVARRGTVVWHNGYGVDQPSNIEVGVVSGPRNVQGLLQMHLNVSPGDSGGGIFRLADGKLVAVCSSTSVLARKATMFGGCSADALKMRPAGPAMLIRDVRPDRDQVLLQQPAGGAQKGGAEPTTGAVPAHHAAGIGGVSGGFAGALVLVLLRIIEGWLSRRSAPPTPTN